MSSTESLQNEINRVVGLINEAGGVLNTDVSHAREDFERSISQHASKIAFQFNKIISKGKVEEAVIGGTCLAVIWCGAVVFDGVKNSIAHEKARKMLAAYYQELAVKQNELIEALSQINKELASNLSDLKTKKAELEQRQQYLTELVGKISVALKERTV